MDSYLLDALVERAAEALASKLVASHCGLDNGGNEQRIGMCAGRGCDMRRWWRCGAGAQGEGECEHERDVSAT